MGVNYPGTAGYGLIINTPASQGQVYALYAFGSAFLTGSVFQASDLAYKKNVVPVKNAVEKLRLLNGVHFEYSDTAEGVKSSETESIGVIAQEVEEVFPSIVRENKEGLKAVNYSALVPVLIEAIKDQQLQLEAQQKEIDDLKAALGVR